MRADRFEEAAPSWRGLGRASRSSSGCGSRSRRALVDEIVRRRDVLGDELDRAMHDGVADIALARQRRVVARRPARAPAALELDELRGARGFGFGRAQKIFRCLNKASSFRDPNVAAMVERGRCDAPDREVVFVRSTRIRPHPEEQRSRAASCEGSPQSQSLTAPAPAARPSRRSVSAVTAQTSASSRSGERPDDRPSRPKSHISSSSAGNAPACFTRPCS